MIERITATGGSTAPIVESFTYDLVGNMLTDTSGRGAYFTITYTYDRRNQLIAEQRPVGTLDDPVYTTETFGYNDAGQRTDTWTAWIIKLNGPTICLVA